MQGQPFRIDSRQFEDFPDHMDCQNGIVVTNLVVTFPELSPPDKNSIHTDAESLDDKNRVHSSGAHDPDGAHVGWVLEP
jgi:hypothetical protein